MSDTRQPMDRTALAQLVEDSIRHSRANLAFTLDRAEVGEANISMNTETILAAVDQYTASQALQAEQRVLMAHLRAKIAMAEEYLRVANDHRSNAVSAAVFSNDLTNLKAALAKLKQGNK